jgi:hypothetical protein
VSVGDPARGRCPGLREPCLYLVYSGLRRGLSQSLPLPLAPSRAWSSHGAVMMYFTLKSTLVIRPPWDHHIYSELYTFFLPAKKE